MEVRTVLAVIFYALRTGTQWKATRRFRLRQAPVHRYFRFWYEQGVFQALWEAGRVKYDEVSGIDWTWLSTDGCMTKAPLVLETIEKNPIDRGGTGVHAICR